MITSQAISLSAYGKASGVQKLFTWRLATPAPRSSTGTSSAGTYRAVRRRSHRADGSANRPLPRTRTVASRGTYTKSVTREKTSSRPATSNVAPSHSTVQPPFSGSTSISSSPVPNTCSPSISSVRSPE